MGLGGAAPLPRQDLYPSASLRLPLPLNTEPRAPYSLLLCLPYFLIIEDYFSVSMFLSKE